MGNVRVAHYLASFHKNNIFVKTRHCFIYPPSVAEMSFLGIPKKLRTQEAQLKIRLADFKLSPRINSVVYKGKKRRKGWNKKQKLTITKLDKNAKNQYTCRNERC